MLARSGVLSQSRAMLTWPGRDGAPPGRAGAPGHVNMARGHVDVAGVLSQARDALARPGMLTWAPDVPGSSWQTLAHPALHVWLQVRNKM